MKIVNFSVKHINEKYKSIYSNRYEIHFTNQTSLEVIKHNRFSIKNYQVTSLNKMKIGKYYNIIGKVINIEEIDDGKYTGNFATSEGIIKIMVWSNSIKDICNMIDKMILIHNIKFSFYNDLCIEYSGNSAYFPTNSKQEIKNDVFQLSMGKTLNF